MIKPNDLDSFAALMTADATAMCKLKGERDTEFVKRIVSTYLNQDAGLSRILEISRYFERRKNPGDDEASGVDR